MNTVNLNSVADLHQTVDGYSTTHHDYKCEICGDFFKSTKMRGPSYDDCIEKTEVDGLCQNSKCQWHRHKESCSGSYHRVQESAHGSLELKRSKAEEALDDGKAAETIYISQHLRSNKGSKSNKTGQEDTSAGFSDDAVGCSGLGSSSRAKSHKKIKLSKDLQTHDIVQEVPKRQRTAVLQNQECSRRKKRKASNWDGTYSVIIEWLNYYSVGDSDEDEIPLINKRTERRKRKKIIEMSLVKDFSNSVKFRCSTSHSVSGANEFVVGSCSSEPVNNKFAIVPASRSDDRLFPNDANHEVAGHHAAHESVSSPLDSPTRGDIIDISDG